ncbi:MAG TPA: signal peptidase I [Verrucomicrobiae bacterium]|nr:signal peptidase I [Verrucomicrobiae bacterium]
MKRFFCLVRKAWNCIPCHNLLAVACAAALGVWIAHRWMGTVCIVTGPSMAPTFEEGDRVLASPIETPPTRGDVVILEDLPKSYAIKRIVGLPGETVTIWRGYVYINSRILLEPYLQKGIYTFPRSRRAVFELGNKEYFVLGDNRPCSADSRVYGAVELKQIKAHIDELTMPRASFGPVLLTPIGEEFRPARVSNPTVNVSILDKAFRGSPRNVSEPARVSGRVG